MTEHAFLSSPASGGSPEQSEGKGEVAPGVKRGST